MNIIGICGQKNSGKSTVAKMIAEMVPGTVEVQLAAPLKKFCADIFDWGDDVLNGPSEMREREDTRYVRARVCNDDLCPVPFEGGECKSTTPVYLTPRHALQQLGTQFGRACYEDVWIDYALRAVTRLEGTRVLFTCGVDAKGKFREGPLVTTVVIPDVRFVNEARKIRKAGGWVWRVRRSLAGVPLEPIDMHASEQEQFSAEMDQFVNWTIVNDRSLELLREDVKRWLGAT